MAAHRANPNRVKIHRCYSVSELVACLGAHKNTIRNWRRAGLEPIDKKRPTLFAGPVVREFLAKRNANRKCPCPPGHLYCLRCRAPRRPALGMADFDLSRALTGTLRALCEECGTGMHRRTRLGDLPRILPGIEVQIREGQPRL